MWLWVDTETTGLDVEMAWCLEAAFILTDSDLNILWEDTYLVDNGWEVKHLQNECNDLVLNMHEKNGLWEDLELGEPIECSDIENRVLEVLTSKFEIEQGSLILCGSTVGFDRRVLAENFPRIESFCHYRSIDVSSVKELARDWAPAVFKERPGKAESEKTHRALDDIRTSIEELRHYRENFFKVAENVNV